MENIATAEGLFTEGQIKYVDSVKDEDLRSHLLHQVRLRDLMEADRNAFERENINKNSIEHAIKIITKALKEDEGYRIGWVANIAMAFKDECYRELSTNLYVEFEDAQEDIHKIANKSAENFINKLCS